MLGPDLTQHEVRMGILNAVRTGELRVLYLQMPFIQDYTIVAAINETQGGLRLLVIDETAVLSTVIALVTQHSNEGPLFAKLAV